MQDEPNIGARLRVLRKWRGLTLVELAQLSGVSKSVFEKWSQRVYSRDRRVGRVAGWPRARRRVMVVMAAQRIMASE